MLREIYELLRLNWQLFLMWWEHITGAVMDPTMLALVERIDVRVGKRRDFNSIFYSTNQTKEQTCKR